MKFSRNARVAVITALAALLLTGCATAQTSPQSTPADNGTPVPTTSVEQPQTEPTLDGQAAFEAAANKVGNGVSVTITEVIDLETFLVEPSPVEQELNGYTGTLTVKINTFPGIVTPTPGACGYDEAIAFLTQYITETSPTTGVDSGILRIDGYVPTMLNGGFAYTTDANSTGKVAPYMGAWADCPEFSA